MEATKNGAPNTLGSIRGSNISYTNKDTENNIGLDNHHLQNDYLKHHEKNENPFPVEIFPKAIKEFIYEINDKYEFPIDYLGAAITSAASVAIGISNQFQFKDNWIEKCNLFTVIVGQPGDGKTPALNLCFKPISDRENELFNKFDLEQEAYEESLEEGKTRIKKPVQKKFLLNDFTPEALIKIHSNNKRGLCIFVDELNGWLQNFQRYNASSEEATYLTLWSGTAVGTDRASIKNYRLDNPFIGVIGGAQINILKEFAKAGRSENGFMDRLLFVYPEIRKKIKWNVNVANKTIVQNYFNIINNLIDLELSDEGKGKVIPVSEEALAFLVTWQNGMSSDYFFAHEQGIEVKLEVYVLRFSLILQLLYHISEGASRETVELFAVKRAVKLYNYYKYTASKVRYEILGKDYKDGLTKSQISILDDLPNRFTTGEGINIACKIVNGTRRVCKRGFYSFLRDKKVFKKTSYGNYEKVL